MGNYLKGVIDREEGEFVVIKLAGEQELYWPKNNLSFAYSSGDAINLVLSQSEPAPENTGDQAKNILRQIFQPNV